MTSEPEEFVDPALRSVIRRAQAGHTAPPDLRRRVADRLAQAMQEMDKQAAGSSAAAPPLAMGGSATDSVADPGAPAVAGRIGPSRVLRRLAAAAVILLVFGISAGYYLHVRHEHAEQHELAEFVEDNDPLLTAMIAAHDTPISAVAGAQPVSIQNGAAAARDEASRQLGRNVPLPDPGKNWTLTDAAIVPLRTASAARFDFARATGAHDKLSLFSFPGNQLKEQEPDGENYDVTVEGHAIAGYTADKCVHCIVGDKSLPLSEAAEIRQHLQAQHAS